MPKFEGFPVNYSMLPQNVREGLAMDIDASRLEIRLREAGTFEFIGNDFVIGQPDYQSQTRAFMALDTLVLRRGARIITNGNIVTILCNKLVSENGSIISFGAQDSKAARGSDGSAPGEGGKGGLPGDSGGVVSLHVIQGIEGILNVDLGGQNGGDGGNGHKGGKGAPGSRGHDSVTKVFPGPFPVPFCDRGGGDGGQGGQGLPGGTGGAGGPGGHGGVFFLFNVGESPIASASFVFKATPGKAGIPGKGGAGGDGGDGGEGGSGSLSCGGGKGGPVGAQGPGGSDGTPTMDGAEGKAEVKNLNLEGIIRHAISASLISG